VRAFERLVRLLLEKRHSLFRISERPLEFWRTVADSPTLTARACELQFTLADDLAGMLSAAVGKAALDPDARLAATMLIGTLVIAYSEALRVFRQKRKSREAFVNVMERGFAGVYVALADTAYV
jgi:hypothetical protein